LKVNGIGFLALILLLAGECFAQSSSFKVFLVGDAGDSKVTGETLDSLKSQLVANPNSAVIFLGDNSYRGGLWGLLPIGFRGFDGGKGTKAKIKSQLDILNDYKGAVYFIPGNHDWWNLTKFDKGKKKLKLEEDFIEENLKQNKNILNPDSTCFLPSDGNPGPVSVELNDNKVRVVFLDTYWLILLGFKKTPPENEGLAEAFYHNLDSILADAAAKRQQIIVAAHHPVNAVGRHAHEIRHPKFLSRLKTSSRYFPSYRDMTMKLDSLLKKYPGSYYVSGHVHALQYYYRDNIHYIISGSGSKMSMMKPKKNSPPEPCTETECRVWNEGGFFTIDFSGGSGKITMTHCHGRKTCDMKNPDDCKAGCN
jgi:UDP-2,3-diacylglucosamine pyrophosphatase LpxH